jgi:hypothetical protein
LDQRLMSLQHPICMQSLKETPWPNMLMTHT